MTWVQAKREIKKHVGLGTDINSRDKNNKQKSHGRIVMCACYGGYLIPRGPGQYMFVTWDMLETCWDGMVANGGEYDNKVFGIRYPKLDRNEHCYVQTIHMIFKKAGLT